MILYPPSSCTSAFPSPATQPSVSPIPMSISPDRSEIIMCPVPEGKGMSSAARSKYFWAKCRGVEKCSGTKPIRRGLDDIVRGMRWILEKFNGSMRKKCRESSKRHEGQFYSPNAGLPEQTRPANAGMKTQHQILALITNLTSAPPLQKRPVDLPATCTPSTSPKMASSTAQRRLLQEYRALTNNPPEGITAGPVSEDDLLHWEALIEGPGGTPFEGGIFPAELKFPKDYPLAPPSMRFLGEVWHPNGVYTFLLLPGWGVRKGGGGVMREVQGKWDHERKIME